MKYKPYTLKTYKQINQVKFLHKNEVDAIDLVGRVLPFKTNNYVVEELIDWKNYKEDPLYTINFPQRELLEPNHYNLMADAIKSHPKDGYISPLINKIRMELNPHPAGQLECNIPKLYNKKINGIQHKYKETMLVFPAQGQTCHSYCTFCFRWPQFTGMTDQKMTLKQAALFIEYLEQHPEITDVLITGGDPMVMSADRLAIYIDALLKSNPGHLKAIRIGTKSLSYWPYRYLTDKDSNRILTLFKRIVDAGIHLSIMAHINHHREMSTAAFREAVKKIRQTGATIRSQSPLLNHVNASPAVWKKMWSEQVNLGIIPYYMFIPRNTGAHRFFSIPIINAYKIFQRAYSCVSGLARTVRGPSMSTLPGKIQINGIPEINGKKLISMSFVQGRSSDWVNRPFFAEYDRDACWINELEPAFHENHFFFEEAYGQDEPHRPHTGKLNQSLVASVA